MIEKIIKDYYKENQSKRLVMSNLSNLLKDNVDFQEFKNTKLGFIKDPTDTQVFWHVLNDDYSVHICLNCKKRTNFNRQLFYHELCSKKCTAIYYAKIRTPEITEEMIRKREETNMELYGARYSSMTEEGKQKKINTCLEIYGVENPLQNKEVHDRQFKSMQDSNMKNYGVKSTLSIRTVYDKTTQTKIDLYGEDYGNTKGGFKRKKYMMPSGKIVIFQGYEDQALDKLLEIKSEDEIFVGRQMFSIINEIEYKFDDKIKRYIPDIYVKDENKIIEVKSEWTFSLEPDMNMAKANKCKELGYIYEFWIFDTKGNLRIITV